jgi:methylated-DNA-protein-cysteine methyltransferase-like protein
MDLDRWLTPAEAGDVFWRVYECVRRIPYGTVATYGEVAREAGTLPIIVGRAVAVSPEGVPWHRVVGAGGVLRIAKRGPEFAMRQRQLLEAEGVRFTEDGRVDMPT